MNQFGTGDLGWKSKDGWRGKAHYLRFDGSTACSGMQGPRGILIGELLRCGWRELDPNDHLCGYCRRIVPADCRCGVCRIKPADVQGEPKKKEA